MKRHTRCLLHCQEEHFWYIAEGSCVRTDPAVDAVHHDTSPQGPSKCLYVTVHLT